VSLGGWLILLGLLATGAGIASHALLDWSRLLAEHRDLLHPLRRVVGVLLGTAYQWAYGVPAALLGVAVYAMARGKGMRALIAWKAFAFATLWVIGSAAFFFGLFIAYAPGLGEGGDGLLVPALFAICGYIVIGLGFVAALAKRG
jgi:hypothetical protein